jgi:hypothetical protein
VTDSLNNTEEEPEKPLTSGDMERELADAAAREHARKEIIESLRAIEGEWQRELSRHFETVEYKRHAAEHDRLEAELATVRNRVDAVLGPTAFLRLGLRGLLHCFSTPEDAAQGAESVEATLAASLAEPA